MARMAKWERGGYLAAVTGVAMMLINASFFGYYTRTRTFSLTYFPDNRYRPANGRGELRVGILDNPVGFGHATPSEGKSLAR